MNSESRRVLVGVDTGGTFTDFVVLEENRLHTAKVLSTPEDPARAILAGFEQLGLAEKPLSVVHGTTVGTNAVLESKGAKVVLITNAGFADLLSLARQNRDDLYALDQPRVPEPVPAELCLETGGRISAEGEILEPLGEVELRRLGRKVRELEPEAVAVNLLFSFLAPEVEGQIAAVMPEGVPVSLSSEVLPELREYERGIATWLNAAVGPKLGGYLKRLAGQLPDSTLAVMQSDGTTVAADQASRRAVHLLLSGPAGGLAAGAHIGRETGEDLLLTFDMGGTSTDVALVHGRPELTRSGRIGRYPVAVPMVDMHTIGAGGGSLARVDEGGLLRVGPESAGADPGPVCYGAGGETVTVTDANLVLGRIPAGVKLGGTHELDRDAAGEAMDRLAAELGMDRAGAAAGVIRVANEHMSRALRVMSAERGLDPARFCLMSFGGAGGLHVCELAESLGMTRALVPARAGVLSALGMLVAEPGRQFSAGFLKSADEAAAEDLEAGFAQLESRARGELEAEGVDSGRIRLERHLECRYRGQDATLLLAAGSPRALADGFHAAHEKQFGHRLQLPVELVTLRLAARGPRRLSEVPPPEAEDGQALDGGEWPVVWRSRLSEGEPLEGPAVILDTDSTTWLAEGWRAQLDRHGHLGLERMSERATG